MRCRKCRKCFSPYLDGELPPALAAAMEGHLQQCPACREALATLADTRRLLSELTLPALPCDLAPRVMQRVHRQGRQPVWMGGLANLQRQLPRLAVASALLLLALAGSNRTAERLLTAWPRQVAGVAGTQIANLAAGLAQVQERLQAGPAATEGRFRDQDTSWLEVRV